MVNHPNRRKRKYGEVAACCTCGQDIQWLGREHGWRDRGNNRSCVSYFYKDHYVTPPEGSTHKPEKGN